ncbi:hypothetical protein Tco_0837268 [Tanacetum coccineum]
MASGNIDWDALSKLLQIEARFEETTLHEGLVSDPGKDLGVAGTHSIARTKRVMGIDNEVGGDDSETSGPETLMKEVVDNRNGSMLTSLVGYESPRSLQLWKKMGIGDVLGLSDSRGAHYFVQPNAGTGCKVVSDLLEEFQVGDMVDALSRIMEQKSLGN